MNTHLTLSDLSSKLNRWMCESALPLWSTIGINAANGSSFERLDKNGVPDKRANMRTRVQARQIFVFSVAHKMQWMKNADSIASGLNHFLNEFGQDDSGDPGYVHLLKSDASVLDFKKDAYDYAFFLLACAYRFEAFGDSDAEKEAEALTQFIEQKFKANYGGWSEGDYDSVFRRQNPHMHLFEAFLTWFQFTKDSKWLARAARIFTLFESFFYDPNEQVINEYFTQGWDTYPGVLGETVEPGHMFEWVWLLRWYAELSNTSVDKYCDALYNKAISIGFDKSKRVIFDEVNQNGEIIKETKRLWPITEYIKASIVQAKAYPKQSLVYEEHASKGIDTLFAYYFHKNENTLLASRDISKHYSGRYYDQLSLDNETLIYDSPASTLYHIVTATQIVTQYVQNKSTCEKTEQPYEYE